MFFNFVKYLFIYSFLVINTFIFTKDEVQDENKIEQIKTNPDNEKKEEKVIEKKVDEPELELLDQVESEIVYFGADKPESVVVTMADVRRRGFDGGKYTIEDLENQNLADQFACKTLKASMSTEDVNRNLKKMGLNEHQVLSIADTWGYPSKDEFYEELKKMYRGGGALNYEIESQLITSEARIKKHYDETPVYEDATYTIETAFVPFSDEKNKETIESELENFIKGKKSKPDYVIWDSPIEINENEITENNKFLQDLEAGQIYVKSVADGFNIFKMKQRKPKRLVPIEKRRDEIVNILRGQLYPDIAKGVKDRIRSQAMIVHPNETYPVIIDKKEFGIVGK